jgi:hypothetical protein
MLKFIFPFLKKINHKMAGINTSEFWINLFKKVTRQLFKKFLKDQGIRTPPPTHHPQVVPHPEGWAIKGAGNEKYTGIFDNQKDAIERAKDIAYNYSADVIIHRKDGSIRDRVTPRS